MELLIMIENFNYKAMIPYCLKCKKIQKVQI